MSTQGARSTRIPVLVTLLAVAALVAMLRSQALGLHAGSPATNTPWPTTTGFAVMDEEPLGPLGLGFDAGETPPPQSFWEVTATPRATPLGGPRLPLPTP